MALETMNTGAMRSLSAMFDSRMAADRAAAARRWLPAMVAALTALAAGMLIGGPLGQGKAVSLVLMLAIGAAVSAMAAAKSALMSGTPVEIGVPSH